MHVVFVLLMDSDCTWNLCLLMYFYLHAVRVLSVFCLHVVFLLLRYFCLHAELCAYDVFLTACAQVVRVLCMCPCCQPVPLPPCGVCAF